MKEGKYRKGVHTVWFNLYKSLKMQITLKQKACQWLSGDRWGTDYKGTEETFEDAENSFLSGI